METNSISSKRARIKKSLPYILIFEIIFVLMGGLVFLIRKNPQYIGLPSPTTNPAENSAEKEQIIADLKKIIKLPDEEPQLATVTDIEKVKGQTFFEDAQTGDKVLIFTDAKKAILYRPSEKMIIEVGVVEQGNQGGVAGSQDEIIPTRPEEPTPTVNVFDLLISPGLTPSPTIVPSINNSPTPIN